VSDDPGFTPPEPPVTLTPPSRFTPPPPAPPHAAQQPLSPQPQVKRPRPWLIGLIVGGALLLLFGAISVLVVTVVTASGLVDRLAPDLPVASPLVSGNPSSPYAIAPVECLDACFDLDVTADTILPPEATKELGIGEVTEPQGTFDLSSGSLDFDDAHGQWRIDSASPYECFFVYFTTPVATDFDERPAYGDTIDYTETSASEDGDTTLYQSARIFPTSREAVDHMVGLDRLIHGCSHVDYGKEAERGSSEISIAPALDLPDTVAATGWREDYGFARSYTFDLQYDNIVVRNVVTTYGEVSETDFRAAVESLALQLSELDPNSGS
jgi:hypothetical protein